LLDISENFVWAYISIFSVTDKQNAAAIMPFVVP